ncbi:MAG: hypothetical protein J3R72DRAFT_463275 [Linnemannia gamsii]|nr:MAG: hypothetical protein J3R72DRAFT_463275 [Linnemannia gamsii]
MGCMFNCLLPWKGHLSSRSILIGRSTHFSCFFSLTCLLCGQTHAGLFLPPIIPTRKTKQMKPATPKPTQTWRSILLRLLQLLILSISLALVYYTEVFFRCRAGYEPDTAFVVLISLAIPLLWILPVFFVIALVCPIFLHRRPQSTYGRRPTWLSPKKRYFVILFPALVSLGVAVYLITPTAWETYAPEDESTPENCKQRARSPLTLILSILVVVESYITFRLDSAQLDAHQPTPATCGKHLCLHKCVSTITNNNLSATPLSSTYCTSVRLIHNTRIVALVIGTFYMAFIVITTFILKIGTDSWWIILAHIFSHILWLLVIISIFRPTITRPAQDLHPTLRLVLSLILAIALLVYSGLYMPLDDRDIAMAVCRILGALFSLLMTVEIVTTFMFDRRRFNTARKVDVWMMQQQKYELPSQQLNGGGAKVAIELVNIEGKFQEAASFDGKIEV